MYPPLNACFHPVRQLLRPACHLCYIYIYMLIYVKGISFKYIGKIILIGSRIQQHNSGLGSVSIEPPHL